MARYDLTEFEWRTIQPLLPNKPRGVPRTMTGVFSTAFSGCSGPARHGQMCRSAMARDDDLQSLQSLARYLGSAEGRHHRRS